MIRSFDPHETGLIPGVEWHEAVRCVGYWEDGKSYVFEEKGIYFAITGGFLKSVYADRTGVPHERG